MSSWVFHHPILMRLKWFRMQCLACLGQHLNPFPILQPDPGPVSWPWKPHVALCLSMFVCMMYVCMYARTWLFSWLVTRCSNTINLDLPTTKKLWLFWFYGRFGRFVCFALFCGFLWSFAGFLRAFCANLRSFCRLRWFAGVCAENRVNNQNYQNFLVVGRSRIDIDLWINEIRLFRLVWSQDV